MAGCNLQAAFENLGLEHYGTEGKVVVALIYWSCTGFRILDPALEKKSESSYV